MQSRVSKTSGFITLVDRVHNWASTHPEREAFVFRRHDGSRFPLSRAAYLRLATRFAARLQSLGLQHGDVVCNFLQNSPERAVTDLGIMLSGAVPMNGAPLLADGADIKGCLQKGRAKALIVDPEQNDGAWEVCQKVLDPCQAGPCQSSDLPDLKQVLFSRRSKQGDLLLFEELEASTEEFLEVTAKPDNVAYIFATSGSTGFSKLVAQTFRSLEGHYPKPAISKFLAKSSFFWNDASLGWVGGTAFCHIQYDVIRVLTDARYGKPSDYLSFLWSAMAEEKVSVATLYSSFINMSLQRRELWEGRHTLDEVVTGGQPVRRDSLKALTSAGGFARVFTVVYGSTEAGTVAIARYEHEQDFEDFMYTQILSGCKVKIVDEATESLPIGAKGEILVKGESLFKEYVGDEEATANAFTSDGWFRTNDLGFLDEQGRFHVMGRRADVIMRGAFIVVPQWLEARLRGCPGVKDAVVVPVPDDVFYQEVCACVIRESGSEVSESDLDAFCKSLLSSGIGEEKNPRAKYYLFFDTFPQNQNLKTDRGQLAAVAAERLGLN